MKSKENQLNETEVIEEVKEELKIEEPVEDLPKLLSEKEKQKLINAEKRSISYRRFFSRVISLILWIIVLGWAGIILFDYFQIKSNKPPMFCIKNESKPCVSKKDDGVIDVCYGLGYKVILPSNKCSRIAQGSKFFGPLWSKDPFDKPEFKTK